MRAITRQLSRLVLVACLAVSLSAHAISLAAFDEEFLPADVTSPRPVGSVTVTFLGTTTMLFDDGMTQVLVDAFLSRPSLMRVLFQRVDTDRDEVVGVLRDAGVDRVRAIFVTHSHYDHALDIGHIAHFTHAAVYGSKTTLNLARGACVPETRLHAFVPWQSVQVGDFEITPILSKHSPPFPFVNDDLGEEIDRPLSQPLRVSRYVEGGTYSLLIRHGMHTVLIVASANVETGVLKERRADVVFLAIGGIGFRSVEYHQHYYDNTVRCVFPSRVIPIHWDFFFSRLSGALSAMPGVNTTLRYIRERLTDDGIEMKVVQGKQRIALFEDFPRLQRSHQNHLTGCGLDATAGSAPAN